MSVLALWWQAVRPFAFTVSVIPPVLGAVIALIDNPGVKFDIFHFILAGLGCMSAHAGANLLSDFFDYRARVDREGTFGSSGLLVAKIMTPRQIFAGGWIAMAVAAVIGAYLVYMTPDGTFLVWLIAIGGAFGVFYTAKPVEFKYKALGDVAVFVSFGPAMVLGAYYVQTHRSSWLPVLYAVPVGLLVDAILHSNNLRDIANDKVAKIRTMPIIIGERRAKAMYYGLVFGAYATTLALVAFARLTPFSLIVFLSFPMALKVTNMVRHKSDLPIAKFAMIDAATAQLHLIFGVLMVFALVIQYFLIGPNS